MKKVDLELVFFMVDLGCQTSLNEITVKAIFTINGKNCHASPQSNKILFLEP